MKKILTFLAILIIGITPVFAKSNTTFKFNGVKYNLLYSAKNPELGGYINEYYKPGETYNLWSEMVGVHHFPNAYSPIDQIIEFRKFLSSTNCPSSISFDEDKNIGIIDFIVIENKRNLVIMEFNAFKYTKSDKCGSVAIQYAKRYVVKNEFEAEEVKREFTKTRKKILKQIEKASVPVVITEDIDKCRIKGVKEGVNEGVNEEPAQKPDEVKKEVKEELNTEELQNNEVNNQKSENEIKEPVKEETVDVKPVAKSDENEKNVNNKKEVVKEEIIEPEVTKEEKAPEIKKENEKVKTEEIQFKEENYKTINTKDQNYAHPRDYKEIIEECKRIQAEQKRLKKAAKKAAKKRAKKADKQLKTK